MNLKLSFLLIMSKYHFTLNTIQEQIIDKMSSFILYQTRQTFTSLELIYWVWEHRICYAMMFVNKVFEWWLPAVAVQLYPTTW
jgi:hypothetical protein